MSDHLPIDPVEPSQQLNSGNKLNSVKLAQTPTKWNQTKVGEIATTISKKIQRAWKPIGIVSVAMVAHAAVIGGVGIAAKKDKIMVAEKGLSAQAHYLEDKVRDHLAQDEEYLIKTISEQEKITAEKKDMERAPRIDQVQVAAYKKFIRNKLLAGEKIDYLEFYEGLEKISLGIDPEIIKKGKAILKAKIEDLNHLKGKIPDLEILQKIAELLREHLDDYQNIDDTESSVFQYVVSQFSPDNENSTFLGSCDTEAPTAIILLQGVFPEQRNKIALQQESQHPKALFTLINGKTYSIEEGSVKLITPENKAGTIIHSVDRIIRRYAGLAVPKLMQEPGKYPLPKRVYPATNAKNGLPPNDSPAGLRSSVDNTRDFYRSWNREVAKTKSKEYDLIPDAFSEDAVQVELIPPMDLERSAEKYRRIIMSAAEVNDKSPINLEGLDQNHLNIRNINQAVLDAQKKFPSYFPFLYYGAVQNLPSRVIEEAFKLQEISKGKQSLAFTISGEKIRPDFLQALKIAKRSSSDQSISVLHFLGSTEKLDNNNFAQLLESALNAFNVVSLTSFHITEERAKIVIETAKLLKSDHVKYGILFSWNNIDDAALPILSQPLPNNIKILMDSYFEQITRYPLLAASNVQPIQSQMNSQTEISLYLKTVQAVKDAGIATPEILKKLEEYYLEFKKQASGKDN